MGQRVEFGTETNLSLRALRAAVSSKVNSAITAGGLFRAFLLERIAKEANLETNLQNTLNNPKSILVSLLLSYSIRFMIRYFQASWLGKARHSISTTFVELTFLSSALHRPPIKESIQNDWSWCTLWVFSKKVMTSLEWVRACRGLVVIKMTSADRRKRARDVP